MSQFFYASVDLPGPVFCFNIFLGHPVSYTKDNYT